MFGKRAKTRKADTYFSEYIRTKAGWKCEYCGKDFSMNRQRLHASHYWGRGRESTRYDESNVMALCAYHHSHLGHGDGRDEYRKIMIQRLGQQGFDALELRANTTTKRDDKMMELVTKQLLKEVLCQMME